jgi:hypothetical protein
MKTKRAHETAPIPVALRRTGRCASCLRPLPLGADKTIEKMIGRDYFLPKLIRMKFRAIFPVKHPSFYSFGSGRYIVPVIFELYPGHIAEAKIDKIVCWSISDKSIEHDLSEAAAYRSIPAIQEMNTEFIALDIKGSALIAHLSLMVAAISILHATVRASWLKSHFS